ncbi:uncharacterized protein N7496_009283 [Penicillium cataractarum]|uniref:Uncharacterized protein n=1 Tax=Penicillium cataractarum TaxID=2100454 RepID=A0A9W9RQ18_9EURO|nr:uncharacterized protein N7496_009283 [Penicillium cataractarum]KAJ5363570.1 hypothetical protein N7496_009283 [Penicillium cataractarum]
MTPLIPGVCGLRDLKIDYYKNISTVAIFVSLAKLEDAKLKLQTGAEGQVLTERLRFSASPVPIGRGEWLIPSRTKD